MLTHRSEVVNGVVDMFRTDRSRDNIGVMTADGVLSSGVPEDDDNEGEVSTCWSVLDALSSYWDGRSTLVARSAA